MLVSVMHIGKVRVSMGQRIVAMPMTVSNVLWHWVRVSMLVVLIVRMFMLVLKPFVVMFVIVPLGQMQPYAQCH